MTDEGTEKTGTTQTKRQRPGFDDEGKPYPGVDPKTGERHAVTRAGLMDEFGDKRGEAMYWAICKATSIASGTAGVNHIPDPLLVGLDAETRAKVDAILTGKE